jgi:hypothetical protein
MEKEKKHFFDSPGNVKKFIKGFYVICALLLIIDFFVPKHGHYYWEDVPEFYAAYGLVACIVLVLTAKYILRRLVKRREDYYD